MTSSSSTPVLTLEEANEKIAIMQAAGVRLQNELAQAQHRIASGASSSAAAVIVHRAKIPSPTQFSGKIGGAMVEFILQIENQFSYYAAEFPAGNNVNMIQFALSWVSEEVRTWYRSYVASNNNAAMTWSEFKAAMLLRYQPIDSSHKARTNLDSAKQTGSVQVYTEYVQKQMALIKNMSDDDQVHQYIRGLKENIQFEVAKEEPATLIECIAIAVRTEAYSTKSRHYPQQSSNSGGYRPHQQRGSPMDINNVNGDDGESRPESNYLDARRHESRTYWR
jgi:hypothetical protein